MVSRCSRPALAVGFALFAWFLACVPAFGAPLPAGPYRIALRTDPAVVPVGTARIFLTVTDAQARPAPHLDLTVLAQMPGMPMGERALPADPVAGQPGTYEAPARFAMAGTYRVTITVQGALGSGRVVTSLSTGRVGGTAAWPWGWLLAGAGILLTLLFLVARRGWRTRIRLRSSQVAGLFVLGGVVLGALYAVSHFRRPNAMTPLEAQTMEMNVPPPPGVLPVVLATASIGTVAQIVREEGQAVGYTEQAIAARVTGVILAMPVYVGSRVKRGELLARLDTTQLAPALAAQRAVLATRELGVRAARADVDVARAELVRARADLATRQSAIEVAQSTLASARTRVPAVRADLLAAQADARYLREEEVRSHRLRALGAYSVEEDEKTTARAVAAFARVMRTRAQLRGVHADVRSARAARDMARTQAAGSSDRVVSAQASMFAFVARESAARAQVAQARATLVAQRAMLGYAMIRAPGDGVVTARLISPGTLVSPGQVILRMAQIQPIRLQANVAVEEMANVRVGMPVRIWSADGANERPVHALITSVEPAVDPTSHTGVVEAVYRNAHDRFLPGSFLEMALPVRRAVHAVVVPEGAVRERPGRRTEFFVWAAAPLGGRRYRVHAVRVQRLADDGTRVAVRGLQAGSRVVDVVGESLLEGDMVCDEAGTSSRKPVSARSQVVTVRITENGFVPARVDAPTDAPLCLVFLRTTNQTCATRIELPALGIQRTLPLNRPVRVWIPPGRSVSFMCGMHMLHGTVVRR